MGRGHEDTTLPFFITAALLVPAFDDTALALSSADCSGITTVISNSTCGGALLYIHICDAGFTNNTLRPGDHHQWWVHKGATFIYSCGAAPLLTTALRHLGRFLWSGVSDFALVLVTRLSNCSGGLPCEARQRIEVGRARRQSDFEGAGQSYVVFSLGITGDYAGDYGDRITGITVTVDLKPN